MKGFTGARLGQSQRGRLAGILLLGIFTGLSLTPWELHGQSVLPTNPNVVNGTASVSTNGGAMQVVNSNGAVINWDSFSIGANNSVNFLQSGADSSVLNRVVGHNLSEIYGSLTSNGKVFLINQNGIFVGAGATINTAGFLASTLDISNAEFKANNGNGTLHFIGNSEAAITNLGTINAVGGDVYLIAKHISNSGSITASEVAGKGGLVGAYATDELYLTTGAPDGGLVRVGSGSVTGTGTGIDNSGVINAVQADLKATGNLYSLAINNSGVIRATGASVKNGVVHLSASGGTISSSGTLRAVNANGDGGTIKVQTGTGGTTLVSGVVDASGSTAVTQVWLDPALIDLSASSGSGYQAIVLGGVTIGTAAIDAHGNIYSPQKGGTVELSGDYVALYSNGTVDVSGPAGGGTVNIGGSAHGADAAIHNALVTYIGDQTVIKADATANGNGGTVAVWSNGTTRFYGSVSAKGAGTGKGGWVETSGKQYLDAAGSVVTGGGLWLLDPADVVIGTNETSDSTFTGSPWDFTSGTGTSHISNADLIDALGGGDVEIDGQNISWYSTTGNDVHTPSYSLKLNASANIYLGKDGTGTTRGLVVYTGDDNFSSLNFLAGGSIFATNVTIQGGAEGSDVILLSNTAGGTAGGVTITGSTIDTNGGRFLVGGGTTNGGDLMEGAEYYAANGTGVSISGTTIHTQTGAAVIVGQNANGTGVSIANSTIDTFSSSSHYGGDLTLIGTAGAAGNKGIDLSGTTLLNVDSGYLTFKGNGEFSVGSGVTVEGSGNLAIEALSGASLAVDGSTQGSSTVFHLSNAANSGINKLGIGSYEAVDLYADGDVGIAGPLTVAGRLSIESQDGNVYLGGNITMVTGTNSTSRLQVTADSGDIIIGKGVDGTGNTAVTISSTEQNYDPAETALTFSAGRSFSLNGTITTAGAQSYDSEYGLTYSGASISIAANSGGEVETEGFSSFAVTPTTASLDTTLGSIDAGGSSLNLTMLASGNASSGTVALGNLKSVGTNSGSGTVSVTNNIGGITQASGATITVNNGVTLSTGSSGGAIGTSTDAIHIGDASGTAYDTSYGLSVNTSGGNVYVSSADTRQLLLGNSSVIGSANFSALIDIQTAGSLKLNGGNTVSTMYGSLSLKAQGDLALEGTVSTTLGTTTLAADSDGNGSGTFSLIYGGSINVGSNTATASGAAFDFTNANGINGGGTMVFTSSTTGGDFVIGGEGNPNINAANFGKLATFAVNEIKFQSNGNILVTGITRPTIATHNLTLYAGKDVQINGTSLGSGNTSAYALKVYANMLDGGGSILVTGSSIYTQGGNILMTGGSDLTGAVEHAGGLNYITATAAYTGGDSTQRASGGVAIINGSVLDVSSTGFAEASLELDGKSGLTNGAGVLISNLSWNGSGRIHTASGSILRANNNSTITVNGTATGGSGVTANHGVLIDGSAIYATSDSYKNTITVNGTGSASVPGSAAIYLTNSAQITAQGGKINLDGEVGTYGVLLNGSGTMISNVQGQSGYGDIEVYGAGKYGIAMMDGAHMTVDGAYSSLLVEAETTVSGGAGILFVDNDAATSGNIANDANMPYLMATNGATLTVEADTITYPYTTSYATLTATTGDVNVFRGDGNGTLTITPYNDGGSMGIGKNAASAGALWVPRMGDFDTINLGGLVTEGVYTIAGTVTIDTGTDTIDTPNVNVYGQSIVVASGSNVDLTGHLTLGSQYGTNATQSIVLNGTVLIDGNGQLSLAAEGDITLAASASITTSGSWTGGTALDISTDSNINVHVGGNSGTAVSLFSGLPSVSLYGEGNLNVIADSGVLTVGGSSAPSTGVWISQASLANLDSVTGEYNGTVVFDGTHAGVFYAGNLDLSGVSGSLVNGFGLKGALSVGSGVTIVLPKLTLGGNVGNITLNIETPIIKLDHVVGNVTLISNGDPDLSGTITGNLTGSFGQAITQGEGAANAISVSGNVNLTTTSGNISLNNTSNYIGGSVDLHTGDGIITLAYQSSSSQTSSGSYIANGSETSIGTYTDPVNYTNVSNSSLTITVAASGSGTVTATSQTGATLSVGAGLGIVSTSATTSSPSSSATSAAIVVLKGKTTDTVTSPSGSTKSTVSDNYINTGDTKPTDQVASQSGDSASSPSGKGKDDKSTGNDKKSATLGNNTTGGSNSSSGNGKETVVGAGSSSVIGSTGVSTLNIPPPPQLDHALSGAARSDLQNAIFGH